MTAKNPMNPEGQPLEKAEFQQGFPGIVGTSGIKTAMVAEEGREKPFISLDKEQQNPGHLGLAPPGLTAA
jgi:hypothetical protein